MKGCSWAEKKKVPNHQQGGKESEHWDFCLGLGLYLHATSSVNIALMGCSQQLPQSPCAAWWQQLMTCKGPSKIIASADTWCEGKWVRCCPEGLKGVEVYRDDISFYGKDKEGYDVITSGRFLTGFWSPTKYRRMYTVRSMAVAFKVYHWGIWMGGRSAQAQFFENLGPRMFLKWTSRDVKEHRNDATWELWLE